MEAAEFIKQRNRMCVYYNSMPEGCYACPAFNAAYHNDCKISTDNPKHLVEIVEQWAREHPEESEHEQQKPIQGTVGYIDPAAFKKHYVSYQNFENLKAFCEQLADRIAKLEQDNAERSPPNTELILIQICLPYLSLSNCAGKVMAAQLLEILRR